ncbi:MAG: MFS transporter [Burkholderiales bacterium]|nr:MFS transporter [Burkholderiales bacterium]
MPIRTLRAPLVILLAGGMAMTIALGARHAFGLYLQPMTADLGWARQTFAFALAAQNLIFGIAQPFSGMLADRFGAGRVMLGGTALYVLGLALMADVSSGPGFMFSAGLLIGTAVSCISFPIVFGVVARTYPPEKRSVAMGIAGAAGSFGQFVMLPYGQMLINVLGWQQSLLVLAATVALVAPLSMLLAEEQRPAATAQQSIPEALKEALGHRGYSLLCAGYFVCGLQVMFVAVHFPAFMVDRGMKAEVGMMALALIGLFNIFGSYFWGWLGGRYSKKRMLSLLYFLRAVNIAAFIVLPLSATSVYVFAAVIGFLWLGTVPLTNALIAQIFGVRYLSTLGGIAFFWHQVGSFVGVALGGYVFDQTGSYQVMWAIAIAAGVFAAAVNWPIDDRQIARAAAKPVAA